MAIEPLFQAALGGFMLNMMNLYQDSKRPKNQRVIKDILYWILFLFWPFAGAAIAYIYMSSGYKIQGWLAFTTGLTAPTTLQAIIDKGINAAKPPVLKNSDVEED